MVPFFVAESEGFKPPIPERGIPDFESSAIDHSANSPNIPIRPKAWCSLDFADAKVVIISEMAKLFLNFFGVFLTY